MLKLVSRNVSSASVASTAFAAMPAKRSSSKTAAKAAAVKVKKEMPDDDVVAVSHRRNITGMLGVLKARSKSSDSEAAEAASCALTTYENLDQNQKRAFVETYWAEGGAKGRKDLKFVKEFEQSLTHNKTETDTSKQGFMTIPEIMDHLKQDLKFYPSLDDFKNAALSEIAMNKKKHGTTQEDILHDSKNWAMDRYWYVREEAQEIKSCLDIKEKVSRSSSDSKTAMTMLYAASADNETEQNKDYEEQQQIAVKVMKGITDFQSLSYNVYEHRLAFGWTDIMCSRCPFFPCVWTESVQPSVRYVSCVCGCVRTCSSVHLSGGSFAWFAVFVRSRVRLGLDSTSPW